MLKRVAEEAVPHAQVTRNGDRFACGGARLRSLHQAIASSLIALALAFPRVAEAQAISMRAPTPVQSEGPNSSGGSATGGTFSAVYDSQRRPITAGGFV